jgi:hypothetical protein
VGGDGQRRSEEASTNKCRSHGGSKANGAKVQLWDCNLGRTKVADQVGPGILKVPVHNEPSDWGVAEVLVAGNLSAVQIQAVEAYLREKYGM